MSVSETLQYLNAYLCCNDGTDIAQAGFTIFCVHMHDCIFSFLNFSCTFSVSSFLTDLRLARRSMETLCLDPSSERRMASADTRTRRRLGLLNFPLRSSTLIFRSLIWSSDTEWREQDVGVSHGARSVNNIRKVSLI